MGDLSATLFDPYALGPIQLTNRIVMASMTRQRAGKDGTPTELMAHYFAQRATAGLLLTDATMIAPLAHAYPHGPGLFNAAHVAGWRRVTDAVHQRSGRIFAQLWHCGRRSHPLLLDGHLPVAPSPIPSPDPVRTPDGKQRAPVPRVLTSGQISDVVGQFAQAAQFARDAGFDGVELHGGNGYLIDQFLRNGSNQRTDSWGGSIANRLRFLSHVVEAVSEPWGPSHVGVKLTPANSSKGMVDDNPAPLFDAAVRALDSLHIAYLHLQEPVSIAEAAVTGDPELAHLNSSRYRQLFSGPLVVNGGYDADSAEDVIRCGTAELVSFGRLFVANPDLPRRLHTRGPFNHADTDTFYGGGPNGYTDYPFLDHV